MSESIALCVNAARLLQRLGMCALGEARTGVHIFVDSRAAEPEGAPTMAEN